MIQSMTGYGKAEIKIQSNNFTIELRSLNSKQIDITVKISSLYREKEIEIRRLISEKLNRGKIELSIWKEEGISNSKYELNKSLIKNYFNALKSI